MRPANAMPTAPTSAQETPPRYELAWASPDRWRLEMRFAGYHSVEAVDDEGPWHRSGVPWVPDWHPGAKKQQISPEVRIDTVQHAMSAVLAARKLELVN